MKQIAVPTRPFGATLRDLLLENEVTTPMGNPDWAGFAQQLPGIHYETLRKAVTGDRQPAPKVIEAVSDALSIPPATFVEYKLWVARRALDPNEVGLEEAVRNLVLLDQPRPRQPSESATDVAAP
jgi:hypothetical protein